MSEEDEWENRREEILTYIETNGPNYPQDDDRALSEALYTMNEMSLWPDDLRIDSEVAIMVWKVVDMVAQHGWPSNYRM